MKRDDIVEKVLTGIIKSQKEYLRWENVSVSQGPEYLITVNIAKELAKLGEKYKPSLELSIKKVARESGISGKLAHSKRCVSGRGDIILYKDEMPHSIIEVKNGVDRIDNIIQDIERISYIISKEKTKTSWKFGVIAFLIDIDLIDRENQNIVDKLENKIKNIFAEAQKISELVREYHYDIRSESYELNGKKRNWGVVSSLHYIFIKFEINQAFQKEKY